MPRRNRQLVLCIDNTEFPASLEVRKIYEMLPDEAEDIDMIRVVDESGEDYLYPKELFAILPDDALDALCLTARTRRRVLRSLRPA